MGIERAVLGFFAAISTAGLFVMAGNYLRRHEKGENVNGPLNDICEELAKREGFDFAGCRVTGAPIANDNSSASPDSLEFVATTGGFFVILLILVLLVRSGALRNLRLA